MRSAAQTGQGIVGDKAPPGRGIDTVFDTDDTRTHTRARAATLITPSVCSASLPGQSGGRHLKAVTGVQAEDLP